ncbi:hypothetical protein E4P39_03370 [Blastococcus sp. CT_GayMR19]|uniref:hypothetical protein n=1 Tax=Blastococcus sp. CT_GayMR19 TaxID=2559608 RepID=UPI0010732650|nr:hypothetical protein [Blastococcus sp. CT_GayMR19]TFV78278.1 hypothetical protein E4P39_03370 [Blastococcus sp. CT_GayMR19]
MTHRLRTSLLTAGVVLALSGCAGTDESPASPSPGTSATESSVPESSTSAAPTTPAGQRIVVTVTGGQVTGDTGRVPVAAGEQVTLVVTSDVADELHLHGYDLRTALTPGTPAELSFEATVPGVFEVELHDAGTVLLSLQVG